MELSPFQKPHPPIWIGAATADSAARAARNRHNFVSLSTAAETRVLTDRYRAAWKEAHGEEPLPKLGLGRFIVVGEDRRGSACTRAPRLPALARQLPSSVAQARHGADRRRTRARVRRDHAWRARRRRHAQDRDRALAAQLPEAGVNYSVGQFVFGDMTLDEALGSIDLFVREVMPAVRQSIS